ncbi:dienelactone hydrolase family protein [Paenibacillus nanensis]|uniref:Dienelactone hydrolase family protein n=1 Tax=Paenibacillus nanensis TaxID=393251 RepID=A0A3A1V1E9_9BACL|nr:dienelactone hydrolase family protein [Paenibacillus nanensis]RIX51410.1 dienelactone hydrolase family protein [Paenibacillus nanensis]
MIRIQHNADTLLVVIHEIYGLNRHMEGICESLAEQGFDVICPNLLKRKTPFPYSEEEMAYQYFMNNVGFARVCQEVIAIVNEAKRKYRRVVLIGFSVGATAAWLCSGHEGVDGIVGYYGSRIRNYTEITPKCPVLLFFPQEERSFQVDELISTLQRKGTAVYKFEGLHGFSDPCSSKYKEQSAQQAFSLMMSFIQSIPSQSC